MKKFLPLLLLCTGIQHAFSQWNNNPAINNLVAGTPNAEANPLCTTDGANGSIIIFNIDGDIYAQRVTAGGAIKWGTALNPVVICKAAGFQYLNAVITDGTGGAYIAWQDYGHDEDFGEIYIQHIDSNGTVLASANGIRVTTTSNIDNYSPSLCTDGSGGTIIAWNWDNYVNNIQASAQRYNSAGTALWEPNGVQIITSPGFRGTNNIVSDGDSGAILFLDDTRDDPHGTDYDYLLDSDAVNVNIYAQRLSGKGVLTWGNNGVIVCNAPGNQYSSSNVGKGAVMDGNGGAIVAFDDERNSGHDAYGNPINNDIYAQKLDSSGVRQWLANGLPVATVNGNQFFGVAVSDSSGGIVAAWYNEADNYLYCQNINSTGTLNWPVNGLMIDSSRANSSNMLADGNGNYLLCFIKDNSGVATLYAQKVDAQGALKWGLKGAPVCINTASSIQGSPAVVLSNDGAAIISWEDNRDGPISRSDIFASKMLVGGDLAGGSVSTYLSLTDGNWNNPSTWEGGVVPPETAVIKVKHNITVTSNATCFSLSVDSPGGKIIVKTGSKLTITH